MLIRIKNLIFFCLLTFLWTFTKSCKNAPPTSEENLKVRTPVTTVPVTFKPFMSTVDLSAISAFQNKNIIRASTAGTIEKISIKPGDYIKANQLLFTIRTRESMALINAGIRDTSLSFKGLINILSKEEGVINSISYQKGDFVQEGDEMAVVADQKSLVFIMDTPFELEAYVAKNRNCTLVLPDKKQIKGEITTKLPEMDVQSQTVRYIIKPSDADRLPANLIATISLVKSSNDKALVLPKKAVLGDETQTEFWVMKLIDDSTAIKVKVIKGYETNTEVEITDPVFLNSDRIILTGNYGLPDTASILIIKE